MSRGSRYSRAPRHTRGGGGGRRSSYAQAQRDSPRAFFIGILITFLVLGGLATLAVVLRPKDDDGTALALGGPAARIDLGSLPKRLPTAVRVRAAQVVTVNVQLRTHHMTLRSAADPTSTGVGGSGVAISRHLVVSAGHIFAPPAIAVNGGRAVCVNTDVDAQTAAARGFFADRVPVFGTVHPVSHIEFSLGAHPTTHIPDLALIHVGGAGLSAGVRIRIARRPPAAGTRLYFVNFQSAPGNQLRDPFTGVLSLRAFLAGMSHPVIFSGFAIGRDGDTINVIDNLRSYGVAGERVLREGGSGGAVFTGSGELVGVSIESSHIGGADWRGDFSQTFTHVPSGYQPSVSVVELVSSRSLAQLADLQSATGHC